MAKKASNEWAGVARRLESLKKSELIALVHDLYELSAETRNFVNARFPGRQHKGTTIEPYRATITARFFPTGEPGDLDFALARKTIADYRKATGDVEGVLDLTLTCVETAGRLASEIAIHDPWYFADLGEVATDFMNLLGQHPHLYPKFAGRIKRMRRQLEGAGLELDDGIATITFNRHVHPL